MLKGVLKREISKQFLRFCLVGLESTVLNYLLFVIFIYFFYVDYTISFIVGFVIGTLFGFIFNKLWSFESKREYFKEIWLYFLVYLISLGAGMLFLRFLVNSFNISPLIANIPVLVLTTFMNFFGTKILAFKNKKW